MSSVSPLIFINKFRAGDWELQDYGISHVIIPKDRIRDLKDTSANSQGVLKKFNVEYRVEGVAMSKLLYVKAGYQVGDQYRISGPVTEALCAEIGILLGFNVMPVNLWAIRSSLFDKVEQYDTGILDTTLPLIESSMVSELAGKSLGLTLYKVGLVLVGVTDSYIKPDYVYNSCATTINGFRNQEELYDKCVSLGPTVRRYLDRMLVFDFLINNPDRHSSNFGFLHHIESDLQELCPLVDHGESLLARYHLEEMQENPDIIEHAKGHHCFPNLIMSLDLVDKESLRGLNLKVTSDQIDMVVDKYAPLLPRTRINLVKKMVKRRWEYVQSRFHP